ncbi:MAG: Gldg family protein [Planctomycetota bacterium]|jgi:hypothetical protein
MTRRGAAATLLLLLMTAAGAVMASRVTRVLPGAAAELGRARLTTPTPELAERLATRADTLFITLYISGRDALPSSMRRLERDVTTLLQTLARASDGRLDFQVVDPEENEDLLRYATQRKIAPQRVRSVERDGFTERTVYCTLAIESGAHEPVLVEGLAPEHLPRLQALLLAHLDQMERPRRPVLALAAPPGYEGLASDLAARGDLLRVDLDGGAPLPPGADVLFWMEPRDVDAARVREVEVFLDAGRSLVVAGSRQALSIGSAGPDGTRAMSLPATGQTLAPLLSAFGLAEVPGLPCDRYAWPPPEARDVDPLPCVVRCIGPNQDFRTLIGQPNGDLIFTAPTSWRMDGEGLQARGLVAEVLASSSDDTWVVPRPEGAFSREDLARTRGEPAPKLPLLVALRSSEAWDGLLVAAAASTPWNDAVYGTDGTAHRALTAVLLDSLASDERLVQARLGLSAPEPLPELPAARRAAWRAVTVLLFPAVLLAVAWARRIRTRRGDVAASVPVGTAAGWRSTGHGAALRLACVAVAVALLSGALRTRGVLLDLTEEGLNVLAPRTRSLAAEAVGDAGVRATLFSSPRSRLSPGLRAGLARLDDELAALERAGAEVSLDVVHPEDLDDVAREALLDEGIAPVQVSTHAEEVTTVRSVWAALRLERADGTHRTVLSFPDAASFESLEFRLAFALWRLQTGRAPHVAFASDAPRLSAAEARQQYQKQGLFAPAGTDVYALARERLVAADFRVTHVNPRDPDVPADIDALVWLQPRRPVQGMLQVFADYLRAGGSALMAMQHFAMQSRQSSQGDFQVVYWPQPQVPDVDTLYLADLGVEPVREVLFDESMASLPMATQVFREGRRELVATQAALPFLVRAVAGRHASDSPITRTLGDQAFPYATWFRLDPERLARHDLQSRVLIRSSTHTWRYAWAGGFLPEALLHGPPTDEDGQPRWLGEVPLMLELEGRFPPAPVAAGEDTLPSPRLGRPAVPGRLLLVACSEAFKDARLLETGFRADHLLLNAVASLAIEPELAAVAGKRPVARGFEAPSARAKLAWRATVLGAHPVLMVLIGLVWALLRRGAPRPAAAAPPVPASGADR